MSDCDDLTPAPPPVRVRVDDDDVRSLLPRYLDRRRADLKRITDWLAAKDYAAIQALGHNLRGSGGAYGLDYVSDIGTALEQAARAGDEARIEGTLSALAEWLERVEIA